MFDDLDDLETGYEVCSSENSFIHSTNSGMTTQYTIYDIQEQGLSFSGDDLVLSVPLIDKKSLKIKLYTCDIL